MITMQLMLTLAVMLGVSNGYGENTKTFNPTVAVKKCDRNKLVVHIENATEGGIIYILGKGPGCKHSTSESSHDYDFRFDTCKVDLSKMFRVIVQQRSYAQTASDKTVQVICAIDVSDSNSDPTSHTDSRSGAEGQHTSQPSETGPIDYIQSKGNEEIASAKYATYPVSADEVGDSLSTWFKVAMKVNVDPPVYQYPLTSGNWKHQTIPVTMTTPTTPKMFTTTPSTEPTTTAKTTDVTTSATTEMFKTVKVITTTPTTTKPEPTAYKHVTIYPTPYKMTTSPKSTKVVGYNANPPTTTDGRSKQIAYDVLLRKNQYQKTLLLIADFLLQREVTRSLHGPAHKKKITPIILLHQLVNKYNHKADNRPYQLSSNRQQTNIIHKILQLLKKGHTRTKDVTTSKTRKHRANGHMDALPLISKHFQQQINLNTLQRLREHVSKNKHDVGHQRKHVNKHKHRLGHHQEHVNKNKHGLGHHQEHVNKNKHGLGHHQEHVNKNKHGLGHHQEHVNKNKHGIGHNQGHVNKHKHGIGHHQGHVNKNKHGLGHHRKHVNKNKHRIGHNKEQVKKQQHVIGHDKEHVNKQTYETGHKEEQGIREEKKDKRVLEKSKRKTIHNQDQTHAQARHSFTNGHEGLTHTNDGTTLESKGVPSANSKGKVELLKQLLHFFYGH